MTPAAEPPCLTDPAERLRQLLAARPQTRLVVGLAGLPGSGKSTLAGQWAEQLNRDASPGTVAALGMDGFHLTRAALARMPDSGLAMQRRGAPWTFDPAAMAQRLAALRGASLLPGAAPVGWPGFEHGVGDPVPDAISVAASVRLVLVEGLYLLHRDDGWNLSGLLDECWFLDVDMATAMQRLAARHQKAWGLTPAQVQQRLDGNDRLNAQLVLQSRRRADWLVRPPQAS